MLPKNQCGSFISDNYSNNKASVPFYISEDICLTASYIRIPAATDTLNESTWPDAGIFIILSLFSERILDTPSPLAAKYKGYSPFKIKFPGILPSHIGSINPESLFF